MLLSYFSLNTLLFLEMFLDIAITPHEHLSWPETRHEWLTKEK